MNSQPSACRPLWLTLMVLVLATLACSLSRTVEMPASSGFGKGTPIANPTRLPASPTVAEVAGPTASSPTDTPVPDVSGAEDCTLNSRYVADVTVPDDTPFEPSATFTKVWRVRNSGTCEWAAGTKLVWVSGDPLGGPASVDVAPTAPETDTEISADLVAPSAPGTYRSTWQLESAEGVRFGSLVDVQIVVPEPATATPTEAPTTVPADLIITDLRADTTDPRQGMPLHIVATLKNRGDSTAENVYWAWRVCVHADTCEFVEAPGPLTIGPGEQVVGSLEYTFGGWSNYTTEAWVDSRELIEESNETNNRMQMPLAVKQALPDLTVASITYTPNPPVQGQNVTVKVAVKNQGSADSAGFNLEWWSSTGASDPRCTWNVPGGVVANGQVQLECVYQYPSWYSRIVTRARVDVSGAVAELDETNNTLDVEIAVSKP
ncbi:MAG: hypothetical protein GX601_15410 [Anaerolineales bacterium]|nr:hypothetical protein [Anaerolineales bacterium]